MILLALALQASAVQNLVSDNSPALDERFSQAGQSGLGVMRQAVVKWTLSGKPWPEKYRKGFFDPVMTPVRRGLLYCSGVAVRERLASGMPEQEAIEAGLRDCRKTRSMLVEISRAYVKANNPNLDVSEDDAIKLVRQKLIEQMPTIRAAGSSLDSLCSPLSPTADASGPKTILWRSLSVGMSPSQACRALMKAGIRATVQTSGTDEASAGLIVLDPAEVGDRPAKVSVSFQGNSLRIVNLTYNADMDERGRVTAALKEKYGSSTFDDHFEGGGLTTFESGDLQVAFFLVRKVVDRRQTDKATAVVSYRSLSLSKAQRDTDMRKLKDSL